MRPHDDLERRRRRLLTVLAVVCVPSVRAAVPTLAEALTRWLGGWAGIGRLVEGMARQGYDLQLTRYGTAGWRATFFSAGREHSITQAVGSGWEPTPCAAVQAAAWATLRR